VHKLCSVLLFSSFYLLPFLKSLPLPHLCLLHYVSYLASMGEVRQRHTASHSSWGVRSSTWAREVSKKSASPPLDWHCNFSPQRGHDPTPNMSDRASGWVSLQIMAPNTVYLTALNSRGCCSHIHCHRHQHQCHFGFTASTANPRSPPQSSPLEGRLAQAAKTTIARRKRANS